MDVVTGAFSYTGRAIAEELLSRGRQVRTLTRSHRHGDPLEGRIDESPLQFQDAVALRRALSGVETLYNTYWVRYARGPTTFERAVANTRVLFEAAAAAGVRRVVHVSVTNPALDSPLPYFKGKAQTEADIASSKLSYTIVRPTLVFGEDEPDARLRRRRHPPQQHRLGAAPLPRLPRQRRRKLRSTAGFRSRRRGDLRRRRRADGQPGRGRRRPRDA